jgi:hypothetical protein
METLSVLKDKASESCVLDGERPGDFPRGALEIQEKWIGSHRMPAKNPLQSMQRRLSRWRGETVIGCQGNQGGELRCPK